MGDLIAETDSLKLEWKNNAKEAITNMRSDAVKTGMQQAPHRSLFNALGMTEEEMERPLVGIVSSYNEIVPGHMNLDKIVECSKAWALPWQAVHRLYSRRLLSVTVSPWDISE